MASSSANLLPPRALRAYRRSRRFFILSRMGVAFGILFIILAVFLAISRQYLVILTASIEGQLAVTRGSEKLKQANIFEKKLEDFSGEVGVTRVLKKLQYDPAQLAREVLRVMPAGVRLRSFNMTFGAAEDGAVEKKSKGVPRTGQHVFLVGKAATRSDLLDFQHGLEGLSFSKSVDGPLQNIVKPIDADFSFDITLAPLLEEGAVQEPLSETDDTGL